MPGRFILFGLSTLSVFSLRVQIIKLLIVQFSSVPRHPVPLRPKYIPRHPILEHPKSVFFPWGKKQVSYPQK